MQRNQFRCRRTTGLSIPVLFVVIFSEATCFPGIEKDKIQKINLALSSNEDILNRLSIRKDPQSTRVQAETEAEPETQVKKEVFKNQMKEKLLSVNNKFDDAATSRSLNLSATHEVPTKSRTRTLKDLETMVEMVLPAGYAVAALIVSVAAYVFIKDYATGGCRRKFENRKEKSDGIFLVMKLFH